VNSGLIFQHTVYVPVIPSPVLGIILQDDIKVMILNTGSPVCPAIMNQLRSLAEPISKSMFPIGAVLSLVGYVPEGRETYQKV
jgi:hypothetical protein